MIIYHFRRMKCGERGEAALPGGTAVIVVGSSTDLLKHYSPSKLGKGEMGERGRPATPVSHHSADYVAGASLICGYRQMRLRYSRVVSIRYHRTILRGLGLDMESPKF